MPSIGEILEHVREAEQRIAVKKAIVQFLRLRYVGRDGAPATSQVRGADGGPVPEAVVESEIQGIERDVLEMERMLKASRAATVPRGT